MACDLLDIGHDIWLWVSIYEQFVINLGIDKCLNE
jgi:hypothetical protein